MVAAAYVLQVGVVTFAIWEAGPPLRRWWMLPTVVVGVEVSVTFAAARRALDAAGGAPDGMAMAWNDVPNVSRVRTLLALTSVASLDWVVASALDMLKAEHHLGAVPPKVSALVQIPLLPSTVLLWRALGLRRRPRPWRRQPDV